MASRCTRLWRESATLVIVSRNALKERNSVFDYRVLMLQRSPKSRFMPGNYVFPGGVLDAADYDDQWMELYHKSFKTFGCDFSSLLNMKGPQPPIFKKSKSSVPIEIAFRICAIRETFEESGVLLLKKLPDISRSSEQPLASRGCVNVEKRLSSQEISQWRTIVHNDASRFIELCRELHSVPDVWSLSEWSNWLSPAFMTTRFDTVFFMCFCDHILVAQHDKKETVHSQWKTPLQVLMDHHSKKYNLAPPQSYTLLQLCRMKKWDELKAFQEDRAKDGLTRILPIRIKALDATITFFPGDDMYPRVLQRLAQATNNEYGVREGAVPMDEFQETYRQLERGMVNFHRYILQGDGKFKLKANCTIGNRLPIPVDFDKFIGSCTEKSTAKL